MNDRKIKYATICSGIECCSVALRGLNWEPVFFSEIDRNPSLILRHRWPTVPNLGDIQKIHYDRQTHTITNGSTSIDFDGQLDVLAGGTPCTDVSTIGQRKGMSEGSGTDSALAFEYVRLVREFRPKWIMWENVDGVFRPTVGKTSDRSLKRWPRAATFFRGECFPRTKLSPTSTKTESRNTGEESGLSDTLETNPELLSRYFLTPKAIRGVIRRAERRKKKIPPELREIMENHLKFMEGR